ncbi:MAG: hypothetical protein JWO87_1127 [Phycisphaerales bacterium]|nr:hypothetical protein [Phycisphaerales bacterium]
MKFRSLLPLLFVGMLASGASAAPEANTKVGTANPSRIFEESQEFKDFKEKLELRGKELEATAQQKKAAIGDLMRQMHELKPGSPQYKNKAAEIDAAKAELQSWGATTQAALDRENKYFAKGMYEKIEAAVGDIAKKEGLDLVVTDGRREPNNIEGMSYAELRGLLASYNVLFSSKNVDLSEKVIASLDKNYAAAKGK